MPVKPNNAATSETTKKISAHFKSDMAFIRACLTSQPIRTALVPNFDAAATLTKARAG
jgi:hypothetical protein